MGHTAHSTSLPRDDDANPIQVLSPDIVGTVQVSAVEGSSTSIALPANTEIIRIASTGAVFIALGPSAVDAGTGTSDSFIFPAGVEFFFLRNPTITHVAARAVAGAGAQTVTITRMT